MAVLILAGSAAIPVSMTASVLIVGVFIAAILAAVSQWIVSAKAKRDRIARTVLVAASTVGVMVPIIYDCGWWQWLCDGLI